ncbi:MAG: ATP-binding protein [Candidatus Omnitrophota bacterium]
MNYYAFIGLFNGVVGLLLSLYIFTGRRQNAIYKSFAACCLSIGFWSIFYAVWQIQTTKELALLCMRLVMLFCDFIPFAFLWFVCNLVNIRLKKWQAAFLLGMPMFFAVFSFSKLMVADVVPRLSFPFWPVPGILANIYYVELFLAVVFSFFLLARSYRKAEGLQKWQIKWVFLTFLPIWAGGCTNIPLWYGIPVYPAPNFFVGVGLLVLSYAISRSRLFDIDAITDMVQEAKLSALGIMATSINHEVRNPLFVIKGLAETLLERPDTSQEKIRDIAQRTVTQAERALEIIHNFSSYAKRQSSKTFDKQSLDVKEIIESVVPLVCSELALDQIRLQVNVLPKTMVCADRHSLEEIFINLIVNACQAINEGRGSFDSAQDDSLDKKSSKGEIEISAKEEKPWLSIKVRDTGPGLPPDQLARIFEPFYTTKSSGTGLGLYVVKQLVEKNGGRADVRSEVGQGTVFTITLPQQSPMSLTC